MTQNNINTSQGALQYLTTSSASVFTLSTAIPRDNTIPQNTEGDQVLTLAITPKFSTSKLLIIFSAPGAVGTSSSTAVALFQDSTANALAVTDNRGPKECLLRYVMTSGTTSSTTFKIRCGPNTGTAYLNADSSGNRLMGGVSIATLTIAEYLN